MKRHSMIFIVLALAWTIHGGELADAVKQARLTGGIIVIVNGSDATYADAAATRCTVHGLETTGARIGALRRRFQASGQYGRVSVSAFNGKGLPYIDGLVNLVAIESGDVTKAEALRILAPRGILLMKRGGAWAKTIKPVPADIDEWRQYLHNADNNGVAKDKVGPPERLRWTGGSRWGRSHMSWVTVTSIVTSHGRLFTIEDLASVEYHKLPTQFYVIARDAFNGCELWCRPLKNWHQTASYVKFVPTQIQRRIAAIGDKVYCTLGYTAPIEVLDAATGKTIRTLPGTETTAEFACDNGVVYAIIGQPYAIPRSAAKPVVLKAIDANSGAAKWTKTIRDYVGGTLAIRGDALAYCTNDNVICCNAATGKPTWTANSPGLNVAPPKRVKAKGKRPAKAKGGSKAIAGGQDNINPTLVLTNDMLYCATVTDVKAYDLANGKLRWTAPNTQNYMKMSDLFIADGLVWTGLLNGHDPKTGKIRRKLRQTMDKPMGHDRCYRNRITDTYYINSKTGGADFVSLNGKGEYPSPWVRGTCGLAPTPANGMLYSSPYSCSCMQGSLLTAFNALYSENRTSGKLMTIHRTNRLVKGPAYGSAAGPAATPADWPAYRNNGARSGFTPTATGGKLKPAWTIKLPAKPTATTVVGDLVFVAARDAYTLYALSRTDGATKWSYTAGGRIDSPPTYHKGFLIFGSRDGWVHCVRARDGVLSWKFCDLPAQHLICADGRLESAWPVSGAVMIHNDLAYFAAGRSSFLDGGLVLYALNPVTGAVVHRKQVNGPYGKNGFPVIGKRNTRLEGFKGGVFSTDGTFLYIRQQAFKPDLTPVPLSQIKQAHLIAAGGFLDDVPQHRTYWTIDADLCYGPNTGAPGAGPQGDILAMNGDTFYEVRGYLVGRHSTKLNPVKGFTLFSGRKATSGAGVWKADWRMRTVPRIGSWKTRWSQTIPLTGNAIAVARDTVFAAGAPLKPAFQLPELAATFAGKKGGVLWTASARDGSRIAELNLPAQPVWDGLAVARGQVFITLRDGTVMSLK